LREMKETQTAESGGEGTNASASCGCRLVSMSCGSEEVAATRAGRAVASRLRERPRLGVNRARGARAVASDRARAVSGARRGRDRLFASAEKPEPSADARAGNAHRAASRGRRSRRGRRRRSDVVCSRVPAGGFARVAFVGVAFACRRGVSGAHAPRILFGGVEAFRRRDDGERGRGGLLVARGALLGRDARGAGVSDAHVWL